MERRPLRDVMQEHLSPITESSSITALRRSISSLSIGLGILGVVAAISIVTGVTSWAYAPGVLLLIIGGVLGGISFYTVFDIYKSRQFGLWAAIATASGAVAYGLAVAFS
ncbi:hypothetical protein [Cryptosporangium aurantiacum]|uniref:Uncharacterized protein n=1 Tax=Cryptosporangium aurantiacum TaxID=134849 RepID=A0A1M7NQI8_9ACTN|nr:hypothetical protein [Cryptosporangium aurantiacum]SHN06316.1 hypothetical protein SAMN05443668_102790 [Cryptosporangium aurantiacum]